METKFYESEKKFDKILTITTSDDIIRVVCLNKGVPNSGISA